LNWLASECAAANQHERRAGDQAQHAGDMKREPVIAEPGPNRARAVFARLRGPSVRFV